MFELSKPIYLCIYLPLCSLQMKRLMNITVVDSNKIAAIFHIRFVLDETVVFESDSSIPFYLYKL